MCKRVVLVLGVIFGSGCSHFGHSPLPEELTVSTWLQEQGEDVRFPELSPDSGIMPEHLESYEASALRFGVAFSGGGTRSGSATLGQIRALEDLGWMDRMYYSSSISGGCWTAIPYSFIPEKPQGGVIGNREFLGQYLSPGQLTESNLEDSGLNGVQAANLADSGVWGRFFKNALMLQGDEIYSRVLNEIFLKRPGLSESRFFSYDGTTSGLVQQQSPLTGHNAEIYAANPEKPYPIASGTVDARGCRKDGRLHTLEMTPHYVGTPDFWEDRSGRKYGGQYLAAMGYDTKYQRLDDDGAMTVRWKRRGQRFTISDILAISGAAPSSFFYELPVLNNLGLPEMKHGHPRSYSPGESEVAKGFPHGDGGNLEGLALRPLLARRANRILAFVNTPRPFGGVHFMKHDEVAALEPLTADEIVAGGKFGPDGKVVEKRGLMDGDLISMFRRVEGNPSPLFENGDAELEALYAKFVRCKKAGEPLVHCARYNVIGNERFGIPAAKNVKVCWVYLDGSKRWVDQLPEGGALQRKIMNHHRASSLVPRRMRRFPNYRTFGEQIGIARAGKVSPVQIVDLSEEQVNALAHLSGWVIRERRNEIGKHLDLE